MVRADQAVERILGGRQRQIADVDDPVDDPVEGFGAVWTMTERRVLGKHLVVKQILVEGQLVVDEGRVEI